MKLIQHTEEGAVIFWCPAGGEVTSDFSPVCSRLIADSKAFPSPLLNHFWTLSNSALRLMGRAGVWGQRRGEWVRWWLGVLYPPGVPTDLENQWSQF